MESEGNDNGLSAGPELTALGKRIEMLRIDRGISKQHLAHFAGTSRQQLWRVMTGKSELTGSLRDRLADALRIEIGALSAAAGYRPSLLSETATSFGVPAEPPSVADDAKHDDLSSYLGDADAIANTLSTLPRGVDGRRLKRSFLDALEDAAHDASLPLDAHVLELRRKVLNGEI
jgi:transcriptional regulator with XRE-family HTH domain